MEELSEILNVKTTAFEFWDQLFFLFSTVESIITLKNDCEGCSRRYIDTYIRNRRMLLLKNRNIDLNSFIFEFQEDKEKAIEGLIMQPLNKGKISRIECYDPKRLFEAYTSLPLGAGYAELLIAL